MTFSGPASPPTSHQPLGTHITCLVSKPWEPQQNHSTLHTSRLLYRLFTRAVPHFLCLSSVPPGFTNPCTHSPRVGFISFRRCFDTTHKTQQRHLTLLNVNKELSYCEVKDLFIEKMPVALSKPHRVRNQSASWCSLPGVFLLSPTCSTVPSLQSQLCKWW